MVAGTPTHPLPSASFLKGLWLRVGGTEKHEGPLSGFDNQAEWVSLELQKNHLLSQRQVLPEQSVARAPAKGAGRASLKLPMSLQISSHFSKKGNEE